MAMYIDKFEPMQDLFFEERTLVTESVLFFGFFLVVLAGLIFMFPAIIGTLFAIFILLAGLFILVSRYYTWKVKTVQIDNLNSLESEFIFIKPSYDRPHNYRFQKIRFIRW
jgi:hypothetical protein